jgi:hypothetical protein
MRQVGIGRGGVARGSVSQCRPPHASPLEHLAAQNSEADATAKRTESAS